MERSTNLAIVIQCAKRVSDVLGRAAWVSRWYHSAYEKNVDETPYPSIKDSLQKAIDWNKAFIRKLESEPEATLEMFIDRLEIDTEPAVGKIKTDEKTILKTLKGYRSLVYRLSSDRTGRTLADLVDRPVFSNEVIGVRDSRKELFFQLFPGGL